MYCGAGTQQRKRMVLQPARNGGLDCVGGPVESRPCSQVACPGNTNTLQNFHFDSVGIFQDLILNILSTFIKHPKF